MKHRLLAIMLVTVLLCLALGNSLACTGPGTQYTLTMASTAGGSVTPAVGAHNYSAATVVNLTATPDSGYRFVNWTGGGADIDDANSAATTITMNASHTVTAHFALGVLIEDVPDTNQPPTVTIPNTIPTNFCAPMAMVNVLGYWDVVEGSADAQNLTAFLVPPNLNTVAEYIGYFMDTNNTGDSIRGNDSDMHPGTWDKDIAPGTTDYVRWDINNPAPPANPPYPPVPLPTGKLGYDWTVTVASGPDPILTFDFYKDEIDAGRPLVVSFKFWNPVSAGINVTDPRTGATVSVFTWGGQVSGSNPPNPPETWVSGEIGHAVTGVGYILDWSPGGAAPVGDYVIVHDNWSTTPENVAIPWLNWNLLVSVVPGP